jgi:hypothetical protein
MSDWQMLRFIHACRRAAATHRHPELCLDLAMRANDRLTMRRLNTRLGAEGYAIAEPLILNGHHG